MVKYMMYLDFKKPALILVDKCIGIDVKYRCN